MKFVLFAMIGVLISAPTFYWVTLCVWVAAKVLWTLLK